MVKRRDGRAGRVRAARCGHVWGVRSARSLQGQVNGFEHGWAQGARSEVGLIGSFHRETGSNAKVGGRRINLGTVRSQVLLGRAGRDETAHSRGGHERMLDSRARSHATQGAYAGRRGGGGAFHSRRRCHVDEAPGVHAAFRRLP